MVLEAATAPDAAEPFADIERVTPELVWHELECGGYRADLALWHELARVADGPILDIGAGSGRVALALATAGRVVTALDRDGALLGELHRRAAGAPAPTVCADARSFALDRRDFALCIVPMQTTQLLGGASGRLALLRRVRTHLRPGGVLACAIVCELEPFDCADGGPTPSAESVQLGNKLYLSRAMRVAELPDRFVIERQREIHVAPQHRAHGRGRHPAPVPVLERNLIELDRVSPAQLADEAVQAGLHADRTYEIAATDEHVGGVVVTAHA